jgi:hypothetical protein
MNFSAKVYLANRPFTLGAVIHPFLRVNESLERRFTLQKEDDESPF